MYEKLIRTASEDVNGSTRVSDTSTDVATYTTMLLEDIAEHKGGRIYDLPMLK